MKEKALQQVDVNALTQNLPGLGSLDKCKTLAKRSRQFPTAMSIVSPKIR